MYLYYIPISIFLREADSSQQKKSDFLGIAITPAIILLIYLSIYISLLSIYLSNYLLFREKQTAQQQAQQKKSDFTGTAITPAEVSHLAVNL